MTPLTDLADRFCGCGNSGVSAPGPAPRDPGRGL